MVGDALQMHDIRRPPFNVEWTLRLFAVLAYSMMVLAVFNNWRANGHPYSLLLLLLTEAFTLILIVFAKRASRRDASPVLIACTVYTSSYFLLLEISGTMRFVPDWVGTSLQSTGLVLAVLSKAFLGRAFGILPAVRAVVTAGTYRLVRHPMYLGYFIGDIGFLLMNASVRNALVTSSVVLVQVLRIQREEAILGTSDLSAEWQSYCSRVRFRVLPPVF